MRDFRDAKAMARTLRDALKAKAIETTHSECLELIAKTFGYKNWNTLAVKVDAARSSTSNAHVVSQPNETLHCSFCGKSQHDVRKLVAGPTVFICDECVGLCNGILEDDEILDSFAANGEHAALTDVRGRSDEELVSDVLHAKKHVERWRFTLEQIKRKLSMRDGDVPAEGDVLASAAFAFLNNKTRDDLTALEQRHERALKRYEDAQRIATTMVGERS